MNLRGYLQIIFGVVLWSLAIVALWRGMWIPLAAAGVLSVVVVLVFAGPSLLAKRKKASSPARKPTRDNTANSAGDASGSPDGDSENKPG